MAMDGPCITESQVRTLQRSLTESAGLRGSSRCEPDVPGLASRCSTVRSKDIKARTPTALSATKLTVRYHRM